MSYTKSEIELILYKKWRLKITDKMVAERIGCSREWVTRVKNGVNNDHVIIVIEQMIKEIENSK